MAQKISAGRIGMMLTAFLLLTLIGIFATYAAPIPGIRGNQAEARLVRALASNNPVRMQAALNDAKPLLGRTAQAQLAALAPDGAGLAQASGLVAAATLDASRLIAYRLRLMIITIGVLGALFAVALLGIQEAP
jgi:hypothetical protein